MSRPILKTLIFSLCATLAAAGALPASALEIQYDYCQDFADSEQRAICQSVLTELRSINKDDLPEVNKLALAAVEQQIPKFNALKEVPYAKDLVTSGFACGLQQAPDNDPWNIGCGPWNAKMLLALTLSGLEPNDEGYGYDTVEQYPAYQAMISKTFKELIDLGKADPKYTSDAGFHESVNNAEQNYTAGMALLRQAVRYFDNSADVNTMTETELLAFLKALPEYDLYNLEKSPDDSPASIKRYSNGLYMTYASDKGYVLYHDQLDPDIDYGDAGIYNGSIARYSHLVTAATTVDPNFKVDLSSFHQTSGNVPTAPNTGTTIADLSAVAIGVTLGGIGVLAGILGAIRLSRLYLSSPLKRRKK